MTGPSLSPVRRPAGSVASPHLLRLPHPNRTPPAAAARPRCRSSSSCRGGSRFARLRCRAAAAHRRRSRARRCRPRVGIVGCRRTRRVGRRPRLGFPARPGRLDQSRRHVLHERTAATASHGSRLSGRTHRRRPTAAVGHPRPDASHARAPQGRARALLRYGEPPSAPTRQAPSSAHGISRRGHAHQRCETDAH